MKNITLRAVLRWALFSIIFGTTFFSCHDINEIESKKNTINYDDPLFQHITNDLKFDPSDVVDYGDKYVAEGDIMFSKADFKNVDDAAGRTAQYAANNLVLSSYQHVMTIFVDPSVKTSTTNWGPAIQDAIDSWNSVSCSKINFSLVSTNALMAITSDNGSLPETTVALTKLPTGNGKPGNLMQINVSRSGDFVRSEKMIIIMHELGHAMGLRHTNASALGEYGDQWGTHLIPETSATDSRSVMNSPTNAIFLSNGDIKAVQNIYPEISTSCLVPLFRYYSTGATDHYYLTNFNLGERRDGYTLERIECHLYGAQASGTVPLYRYYNKNAKDHFYSTTFIEPDGYDYEATTGYIYTASANGRLPLYRYWSSGASDHFYTTDFSGLGNGKNGYVLERIEGYVLP